MLGSGKLKRKKAYFSISAVADMFSVHQQTIRLYEKEGLITPKRTDGNTRLFSEEDVNRLEEIIYLTHQLGINLAGVDMIFKLQKQIKKMQKEMNDVFNQAQQDLEKESAISQQLAKVSQQRLISMKPSAMLPALTGAQKAKTKREASALPAVSKKEHSKVASDEWDVEYED